MTHSPAQETVDQAILGAAGLARRLHHDLANTRFLASMLVRADREAMDTYAQGVVDDLERQSATLQALQIAARPAPVEGDPAAWCQDAKPLLNAWLGSTAAVKVEDQLQAARTVADLRPLAAAALKLAIVPGIAASHTPPDPSESFRLTLAEHSGGVRCTLKAPNGQTATVDLEPATQTSSNA
jgi:hypothetical protein